MKHIFFGLSLIATLYLSMGASFAGDSSIEIEINKKKAIPETDNAQANIIAATVPEYFTCIEECKEDYMACMFRLKNKTACIIQSVACRQSCDEASKSAAEQDSYESSQDSLYWGN